MVDSDLRVTVNGGDAEIRARHIRYPRLAPGETTRINVVLATNAPKTKGTLSIYVSYQSLSGAFGETASFSVATRSSRAWTADPSDGESWDVKEINYVTIA